jgi:hypothetical protein
MTEKSPGFSLNMMKISILGENSPKIFPWYDENLRTRGKVPLDFPYIWRKFQPVERIIPLFSPIYEENFKMGRIPVNFS